MAAQLRMSNMGATLQLLTVLGLAASAFSLAIDIKRPPTCQEFSQGVTFDNKQALGTWHILHFEGEKSQGPGKNCVEFMTVTDEERKALSDRIGNYVENLVWENVTMKMHIPCEDIKANQTRDYYLERLGPDGSYRSIPVPSPTAKLEIAKFNRYPMRMKLLEGEYLAMMDCHEKVVFVLGKQPPEKKALEESIQKTLEAYLPQEV